MSRAARTQKINALHQFLIGNARPLMRITPPTHPLSFLSDEEIDAILSERVRPAKTMTSEQIRALQQRPLTELTDEELEQIIYYSGDYP